MMCIFDAVWGVCNLFLKAEGSRVGPRVHTRQTTGIHDFLEKFILKDPGQGLNSTDQSVASFN